MINPDFYREGVTYTTVKNFKFNSMKSMGKKKQ